ncbi:MAG: hypothetical protein VW577_04190, partial [Pelagibacteraceae bacterium]
LFQPPVAAPASRLSCSCDQFLLNAFNATVFSTHGPFVAWGTQDFHERRHHLLMFLRLFQHQPRQFFHHGLHGGHAFAQRLIGFLIDDIFRFGVAPITVRRRAVDVRLALSS